MAWSIKQLQQLKVSGKIVDFTACAVSKKVSKNHTKAIKQVPKGVTFIKEALQNAAISYETEYYFAKPRMFRFDIAIPDLMVAIEYEGLVATGKKGGHQTKAHYTSNCTKYNLASEKGWKLYRYTYKNYRDFDSDLKRIIQA